MELSIQCRGSLGATFPSGANGVAVGLTRQAATLRLRTHHPGNDTYASRGSDDADSPDDHPQRVPDSLAVETAMLLLPAFVPTDLPQKVLMGFFAECSSHRASD
jgi:hypothetical protein